MNESMARQIQIAELEALADVQLWELRETLAKIRALKGARA